MQADATDASQEPQAQTLPTTTAMNGRLRFCFLHTLTCLTHLNFMTVETPSMIEDQRTNHVLVTETNDSEGPSFHLCVVYIIGDTKVSLRISARSSSYPDVRALPFAASDARWEPM
jgi:hypothetical protein